ncbi:hypothetical protein J7J84_01835 [bacterium]|nr:hypothetical protein [bacterium]
MYRHITWLSLTLVVFVGFFLPQSCGSGGSPHRFFQVVTDNPAATADQQSAQEGGTQETQLGEAPDESPADEPSSGDTSNEEQDDQFFEIPPESIPPLPEGVVGYMPEWAMDKAVEKEDFALLPQVGYGEEFVESFDFEITHDWAVYEGKEVVRLEVKAFGCNELPFIHILMAVRPLTWTPLFAEPGDIFPLDNYYSYMSALDHLGDGYLVMTGNLTNSPVFDEGPQPGSKFTGSGTLVYLYFIDEPNDPDCDDGFTDIGPMKGRLKSWIPTAALELSEVYTYEMFGGDDNPHIGDTSPGTGTSFSRCDKQVSEEPAGWLDWFELTPEEKLQGYPPASGASSLPLTPPISTSGRYGTAGCRT